MEPKNGRDWLIVGLTILVAGMILALFLGGCGAGELRKLNTF